MCLYTDYMLLVDGDFMMSPHFEESFQLAISQMSSLSTGHLAYVVPAFELVAEKWNPEQVNTTNSSLLCNGKWETVYKKLYVNCLSPYVWGVIAAVYVLVKIFVKHIIYTLFSN